jgi:acetyl esterase/lipase
MRTLLLSLACAALLLPSAAAPRTTDSEAGQQDDEHQVLSYGPDPLQTVDVWTTAAVEPTLMVFVHGGGWSRGDKDMMRGSAKLEHWQYEADAAASVNYRLVPDATVEQQAADIASALALLKSRAESLNFDPRKIVLVGHSAGAHLVALLGTDETYLRRAGLSFADIAGVVLLDGAAYDVPTQLENGPGIMQRRYREAFGTDPARQARLSPTRQAAAPNAPAFLILHVQRPDGVAQSKALAAALRKAGTQVEIQGFPGTGLKGHREINQRLGEPDYPPTQVLDRWLAKLFG